MAFYAYNEKLSVMGIIAMQNMNTNLLTQVKTQCQDFCATLTDDETVRFIRYTRVVELQSQEILADVNQLGDRFYLVIAGVVRLYHVDGDKEYEVGHINAGGLVGEMSFFDRRPRTVRLRAYEHTVQLLEISRPLYSRLKIEEPYIATNLLEFVIRSLDFLVRYLSDENAQLHKKLGE